MKSVTLFGFMLVARAIDASVINTSLVIALSILMALEIIYNTHKELKS